MTKPKKWQFCSFCHGAAHSIIHIVAICIRNSKTLASFCSWEASLILTWSKTLRSQVFSWHGFFIKTIAPAHEIMVLITLATSDSSGEPAHLRSLARAFAVRTHEVWKKTKGQTKHQISSSTGWLRMCIWRMNLRRMKSTIMSWHGSFDQDYSKEISTS